MKMALSQARATNNISDWTNYRYWDEILDKYDLLQKLVTENAYF